MSLTFALAMPIGPSREGHPLLEQALRSIAAQSPPVTLAVLDASGSEAVAALLDRYSALIGHRRTGPDNGQAAAIQEGWDVVSADVYGWLNADDLLAPDALDQAVALFGAHPGAEAVTGQSLFFDHDPATGGFSFTGVHPEVAPPGPRLCRTNTISQPSTFVRRAALERIGWLNTSLHYTMDWDLWVRLQTAGVEFACSDAPLSAVLMTPGTKTSTFNAKRRREINALVRRHAGAVAAWKSLFGFWLTHQADREARHGPFSRLRDRLQGEAAETVQPDHWPIFHYADQPLRLPDGKAIPPGTSRPVHVPPGGPCVLSPAPT